MSRMDEGTAIERAREMRVLAMQFERWKGWVRLLAVLVPIARIGLGHLEAERTKVPGVLWQAFVDGLSYAIAAYALALVLHAFELLLRSHAAVLLRTHEADGD